MRDYCTDKHKGSKNIRTGTRFVAAITFCIAYRKVYGFGGVRKLEKQAMSRRKKEKVKKKELNVLSKIAEETEMEQKYGEPYIYLRFAMEMEKRGYISLDDLNVIAEQLLSFEILRIENKVLHRTMEKLENIAEKEGVDVEKLFMLNAIDVPHQQVDENFVDTSKLCIGMVVKDYKTMCFLLGEKENGGNARNEQMENWLRYFDYEKLKYGNSFIIMDIYDEPISKEEKRYRHSNFVNELKVLILKEISRQKINDKGNIIYYSSYSRLIRRLHIINPLFYVDTINFFLAEYSKLFTEENIKWNYQIFRSNTFRKVKDSVRYALDALEKDDMLKVEKNDIIGIRTEDKTVVYHQASDDEKAYIITAKKMIANRLGYKNSIDACLYDAAKYNTMLNTYYKVTYGWDIVYFQLKLIANQKNVMKHINEYTALADNHSVLELSSVEVKLYQGKYNERIVEELQKQASNMHMIKKKNYIKKIQKENIEFADMDEDSIDALLEINKNKNISKYSGEFSHRQNVLIDYLVKFDGRNSQTIKKFLSNIKKEEEKAIDSSELIPEFDFID